LQPGLPAGLDQIVARALAKDREERYADGKSMAEDLEDVIADRPPRHAAAAASPADAAGRETARLATALSAAAGTSGVRPERPSGGRRRRSLFLGLGAAVLVAVGIAAALMAPGQRQDAVPQAADPPTTVPVAVLPGQLEITVQHPLKTGVLKVWVDDK